MGTIAQNDLYDLIGDANARVDLFTSIIAGIPEREETVGANLRVAHAVGTHKPLSVDVSALFRCFSLHPALSEYDLVVKL